MVETETPTRKESNHAGQSFEEVYGLAEEVSEWEEFEYPRDRGIPKRYINYRGMAPNGEVVTISRIVVRNDYFYSMFVHERPLWFSSAEQALKTEGLFNRVDSENYELNKPRQGVRSKGNSSIIIFK